MTSAGDAEILNPPLPSVIVEAFEPFTDTVTPASPFPALSVTFPCTVFFVCPKAKVQPIHKSIESRNLIVVFVIAVCLELRNKNEPGIFNK